MVGKDLGRDTEELVLMTWKHVEVSQISESGTPHIVNLEVSI